MRALRDFLVLGYARKEVCERYKVSYGYFSLAFKRIRYIEDIICRAIQCCS
ncbi:hypothetical protein FFW67_20690 [Escherichia coli]|nr:hypothetical protein [Escherichia coli]